MANGDRTFLSALSQILGFERQRTEATRLQREIDIGRNLGIANMLREQRRGELALEKLEQVTQSQNAQFASFFTTTKLSSREEDPLSLENTALENMPLPALDFTSALSSPFSFVGGTLTGGQTVVSLPGQVPSISNGKNTLISDAKNALTSDGIGSSIIIAIIIAGIIWIFFSK
ncbi:hypothetical protein L0244_28130 [bacterium]|nr:hypothetical protein [bacterium]